MYLHLLVLLTLTAGTDCLTAGREFVFVFPENIAYYYPVSPTNTVRVAALHNNTQVTIHTPDASSEHSLQSGDIKEIDIESQFELNKAEKSKKAVRISSTENITLEIVSGRNNSIHTALLVPTTELGKVYKIPSIPKIQDTTQPTDEVTNAVTERSFFKLIIVNNKDDNDIRIEGSTPTYALKPYEVLQIWVTYGMVWKKVIGIQPFLVLFGHSCAVQFDCTCGVLYTPLYPSTFTTSEYIVPAVFSEGAEGSTFLLKTSNHRSRVFSAGLKTESGPLLLQRPGMLMNMIPKEEFGSCYAIHKVANAKTNTAIIVTHEASTGDVYIGSNPVTEAWTVISGTDYKYTRVELSSEKSIIWNKSERMAVWFVGKVRNDKNAWFGHPAARLSVQPDYRGCVVQPDTLEVLPDTMSWKESIQACKNHSLLLITLADELFQNQIYRRLLDLNLNLNEMWMGMRQSALSREWYWYDNEPMNHKDWTPGSPGSDEEKRCVRINLTDTSNPGWSNTHCCNPGRPVCYEHPKLLTF